MLNQITKRITNQRLPRTPPLCSGQCAANSNCHPDIDIVIAARLVQPVFLTRILGVYLGPILFNPSFLLCVRFISALSTPSAMPCVHMGAIFKAPQSLGSVNFLTICYPVSPVGGSFLLFALKSITPFSC